MVREETKAEAWVEMPDADAIYARVREAAGTYPYDFGFMPAMGRLILAHGRLAPAFSALFSQIMFSDEGALSRREREMVASVAAAAQDCNY